ncbi:MAG: porin family protein [Gemmatimonadota bacterium]|nr:porin family protein [Gemmatimonadota bacterium]
MRFPGFAMTAMLSALSLPAGAQQLIHLGVAGGGVFPVGKLDSSFTSGRSGLITLSLGPQDAVFGVRLDYQYDEFRGKTLDNTRIPDFHVNSATANIVVPFRLGYAKPYIIGGYGRYPLHIPGILKKETDWGGNIGAGIGFPIPGTTIGGFVEARYHDVNRSDASPYHFVPVTLGILF